LNDECIVVGDLHGHFGDLMTIINKMGFPGKRHYFVFNGDWVDRGNMQIELIMVIFYSLNLYPNRVFLNRGNHEDKLQNSHHSYKPSLKSSVLSYFGKYGDYMYYKINELFTYLPLCTIINNPTYEQRYFVVHAGINDKINLEELNQLDRSLFKSVSRCNDMKKNSLEYKQFENIVDLLWSDPCQSNGLKFNKARNIGKLFGKNVTRKFLKNYNFTMLIRSHQCKSKGFQLEHDGQLLTVFSASNYSLDNWGAIVKIASSKRKIELLTYNSKRLEKAPSSRDRLLDSIRYLRAHLFKYKSKIFQDCFELDKEQTGYIQIGELVSILNKYLPNIPYEKIKDRLCECDDLTNMAKYKTLFVFAHPNSKYSLPNSILESFEELVTLFRRLDLNNDGFISVQEFKQACLDIFEYKNVMYSESEISNLINTIDKNKDGQIDLEEFENAFSIYCIS
jgi:serine/threonine-protein phosphatase with EF-hand domain